MGVVKISVQVKPNCKKELVEQLENGDLLVKVNVPPVDGKANKRVIELLSKYLKVSKSRINLLRGHKSKKKKFEILD